ncbi:MAG: GNAT family N-acetyltransferase [Kiritimatiellaeota bacterium]|nr:GNAT family N-acetyltransferase [Kiritimatiellota bacterium]
MNITFRSAKPEDAETLFKAKIASFGEEFRLFDYAAHGHQDALDDCDENKAKEDGMFSRKWHGIFCSDIPGIWSLVIEADSQIIGQIVACSGEIKYFLESYSDYDLTGKINVLFSIYVVPEHKNKGIGKLAMEHMERLHPADKWILDTPKASPKNKHFYEKCGYTQGAGENPKLNVYTKGFDT